MRLKRHMAALALACAASAAAPGARAQDAPAPQEPPARPQPPEPVNPPTINLRVVPAAPPEESEEASKSGAPRQPRLFVQAAPAPAPSPALSPAPPGLPGEAKDDPHRKFGERYFLQVEGRTVKATYLGVSTSPVPPALRQHLNLPEGVGLVVDFVEKGSPAEAAGLKQYDVLHKMDDQILVNAQQLAVLVRARKAGQEAKLVMIRGGKPESAAAKLVEKEVKPLTDTYFGTFDANAPFIQLGRPADIAATAVIDPPRRVEVRLADDRSVLTFSDERHTLTVTRRGEKGGRHLTAMDRSGKVLFDGPIDEQEQRANLPGEVAEKLKQLEAVVAPAGERPTPREEPDGPRSRRGSEIHFAPHAGGQAPQLEPTAIGPDDLVEIRVSDLEGPGVETVKVARVRKGQVTVPHVGPVKAEGLTPDQFESEVVRAFRDASLRDHASVHVRKLSDARRFEKAHRAEPAKP